MNLVDAVVVEVVGEPREAYGRWWVDVRYDSYGRFSDNTLPLMFDTYEEARLVEKGYKFEC